jgi:hypothetical protein
LNILNFKYSSILLFLFFLVSFILTRQVPLNSYSIIMNLSILFFIILNWKDILVNIKKKNIELMLYITSILMLSLIFYSLYLGNEVSLIIRFFMILSLVILSYLIKPNKKYISIFIFFITLQAVFIILFEIYLTSYFNIESYYPIRLFFQESGWGDVYTRDGIMWKIQTLGNALLPFAFFISVIYYKGLKKIIYMLVFLIAILCAGNFAFILAIILFFILYYFSNKKWTLQRIIKNGIYLFLFISITSVPVYNHFSTVIAEKAISSNPIRIDQSNILINNMNENISTILFGKGLGNKIQVKTQWRDYSNNIYYEMQALYIMNQIGILFFIWFIFINILLSLYFIRYKVLLIAYGSYIFYALFNPYFLDTNHIVVIIVLLSLRKVLDEKNILNTGSI